MKTIIFIIFVIFLGCQKQVGNESDPSTPSYLLRQFLYINFEAIVNGPAPAPSNLRVTYGQEELVFYKDIESIEYKVSAKGSGISFLITPSLPEGLTLNQTDGSFSGKPLAVFESKKFVLKACNRSGCLERNISIRVISLNGIRVYGQSGSFVSSSSNLGSRGANSLSSPMAIIADKTGGVYIADTGNVRVLFYPNGSTTATLVYGQSGAFNTANSGVSSTLFGFSSITGLALDSSGSLYVADSGNYRVVVFPPGITTASQVYAQSGNFVTVSQGTSQSLIQSANAIAIDSADGLYLADGTNNRVLYFSPGSYNSASRVYGQAGGFNTNIANLGGISASSLSSPNGVSLDPSGGLYISDSGNSRVLYFSNPISTTATQVYGVRNMADNLESLFEGQDSDDGVSRIFRCKSIFATAAGFYVAVTGAGVRFFPKDAKKHIFSYGTNGRLYGNSGDLPINAGSISGLSNLNTPVFVASDGKLFISDSQYNRALMY